MSPSPNHITPINSIASLINYNNCPSPNNHVLNPNPSIIEKISKLSNNDDQHEVQLMPTILTTDGRSHLKQS